MSPCLYLGKTYNEKKTRHRSLVMVVSENNKTVERLVTHTEECFAKLRAAATIGVKSDAPRKPLGLQTALPLLPGRQGYTSQVAWAYASYMGDPLCRSIADGAASRF